MSTLSITDLLGLVPAFTGANQQQPNTVINVGANGVQPAYGSPSMPGDEFEMVQSGYGAPLQPIEGEMDGVELSAYGDPDPLKELDINPDFLGAFAQELDRGAAMGDPSDFGGIFSRIRGAAQSATGKTAQQLTALVTRTNQLVSKVNGNGRKIASLHKMIQILRRNERYGRMAYSVVQREFGKKQQYYRAMLSAAQSIPGVRALNLFESEQLDKIVKAWIEQGDAIEDWKVKTSDTPYTLTATSATPTADEVKTQVSEVATALEDLRVDMRTIQAFLKAADLKTNAEAFDDAKKATLISGVAKISPSQITRKEEALAESVAKYIGGMVSDGESGLSLKLG